MRKISTEKKPCKGCDKEIPARANKLYCGVNCPGRSSYQHSVNKILGLSPGTVGAMSELLVSIDLMKKGYDVYRALSPASGSDIIAIKGETILKLEIRTGHYSKRSDGSVGLNYVTKRLDGKHPVVFTYADYKIHYITLPELNEI